MEWNKDFQGFDKISLRMCDQKRSIRTITGEIGVLKALEKVKTLLLEPHEHSMQKSWHYPIKQSQLAEGTNMSMVAYVTENKIV